MSNKKEKNALQQIWHYRKEIMLAMLSLIVLIFLYQNSESVEFQLIFWKMEVPLIVLLLSFLAIGGISMWIYLKIKAVRKKNSEKPVNTLKNEKVPASTDYITKEVGDTNDDNGSEGSGDVGAGEVE